VTLKGTVFWDVTMWNLAFFSVGKESRKQGARNKEFCLLGLFLDRED
jgi:hypothetical protein